MLKEPQKHCPDGFASLNASTFQVTLVKNRPSEDGSENGSDEGDLESNNNSVFPLDQNALARIHFVKALKPAQVRFARLPAAQPGERGHKKLNRFASYNDVQELVERLLQDIHNQERKVVGLDFKTVTVGIDGELFLSLCGYLSNFYHK